MKKFSFTILLLILLSNTSIFSQQILSVTSASQPPYNNLTNLVRDHLTGSGIEILSIESSNSLFSFGFFTDGDTAIGLNRGLIISTGGAITAQESGNDQASDSFSGLDTLSELMPLATGNLHDVAYVRIRFKPFSDSIQFRYIFGSEEYPEYACTSFNDIFGFFLSGPNPDGGNYTDENIALIPGTNLPVSINNLHPENLVFPSCPPVNAQFYHDNEDSNKQPVYDGFTDIFTAKAKVIPCGIYEMLLAISDVGDGAYDSAVFLEANSLESAVEIASSLEIGNDFIPEIANADTITFSFNNIQANLLPLQVKIQGTATNGVDYQAVNPVTLVNSPGDVVKFVIQPIPDALQEDIETVEFVVCGSAGNACFSKTFTLYIADPDSLYAPVDSLKLSPGGNLTLSVIPSSVSNKTWTFSSATPLNIQPTGTLVKSNVMVDQIPFETLEDITLLHSVCLNIDHSWDEDLDLYLIAPNGTYIDLSTDNGGNGDDYTNTCFSPSATSNIRGGAPFAPASAAPFSGEFQPEGPWKDILGTPISGIWSLGALDDQNNISGILQNWEITFSTMNLGNFNYLWNTGETTAEIQISTPGNYQVIIQNKVGTFTKTFIVSETSVGTVTPEATASPFSLFPNPSVGETVLKLNKALDVLSIQVYDLNGKMILEQFSAGPIIGSGSLPKGIYVVSMACAEGVFIQKMIRR
jgi:subtilisin-like proprotein convertase family protein